MPLSGTDAALITSGLSTLVTLTTVIVNRRSSKQTVLSQETLAFRTRLWDKQIELYLELIQLADRASELRRVNHADALEFVLKDEDKQLGKSLSARIEAIASDDVVACWYKLAEAQWGVHFAVRNRKFEQSAEVQDRINTTREQEEMARNELVDQIRKDLSGIRASRDRFRWRGIRRRAL